MWCGRVERGSLRGDSASSTVAGFEVGCVAEDGARGRVSLVECVGGAVRDDGAGAEVPFTQGLATPAGPLVVSHRCPTRGLRVGAGKHVVLRDFDPTVTGRCGVVSHAIWLWPESVRSALASCSR